MNLCYNYFLPFCRVPDEVLEIVKRKRASTAVVDAKRAKWESAESIFFLHFILGNIII